MEIHPKAEIGMEPMIHRRLFVRYFSPHFVEHLLRRVEGRCTRFVLESLSWHTG